MLTCEKTQEKIAESTEIEALSRSRKLKKKGVLKHDTHR